MIEGEKLGSFWGYTFAGVWQEDDVMSIQMPLVKQTAKPTEKCTK